MRAAERVFKALSGTLRLELSLCLDESGAGPRHSGFGLVDILLNHNLTVCLVGQAIGCGDGNLFLLDILRN